MVVMLHFKLIQTSHQCLLCAWIASNSQLKKINVSQCFLDFHLFLYCKRACGRGQLSGTPDVQFDTEVDDSQASSASPAARWVYCCLLPLEVERCLIEGLYNALKRLPTVLGPKLLLLSCPGTAPCRRKTRLLTWRKQGKETHSCFWF